MRFTFTHYKGFNINRTYQILLSRSLYHPIIKQEMLQQPIAAQKSSMHNVRCCYVFLLVPITKVSAYIAFIRFYSSTVFIIQS